MSKRVPDRKTPNTTETPPSVPDLAALYVPKLVVRGEGRVYWDTPDGLPPATHPKTQPDRSA